MNSESKQTIQNEMRRLRLKRGRIEVAERRAESKKYLGRCFKYRNNYACPTKPSDYWWLWAKVVNADRDGRLALFEFQTDKNGESRIDPGRRIFGSGLISDGYQEVPASAFNRAWAALVRRIKAARP